MKVAVVGSGYVGLITGLGLASKGHFVLAIDINSSRVAQIKSGIVPFHEPGVVELLKKCLKEKSFQISSSMEDVSSCEVVLICVQTPSKLTGSIDLQFLKSASLELSAIFSRHPKQRTVVVRSTVIPGTTANFIVPIFKEKTDIVFNPEFIREGSALEDFLKPDRIVIGTNSDNAARVLKKLYAPFKAPVILTTPTTAELAKYTSNALLATLVSFSNEIAKICELTVDTDVENVLDIVHQDRRFRSSTNPATKPGILAYLKAGCGFGGSCLPKDLSALISYANSLGEKVPLLEAVVEVNKEQPVRIVKQLEKILGRLARIKVTVLGVAFKGGTDDLRGSPGLRIVDELLKNKTKVTIYDPLVKAELLKGYTDKGVVVAQNLRTSFKGADACIIASNSPEFIVLSYLKRNPQNKKPIIIDGRRILKLLFNKDGYFGVGRVFQTN